MNKRFRAAAWILATGGVFIAALLTAPLVVAKAIRIDDTGTVVSDPVIGMKWKNLVPGRGANHTVEASTRVDLALNLAAWLNKRARVYMVLAPTADTQVIARWSTQGRLLSGSVRSGERTLVFDGLVSWATLRESIFLYLQTDGRYLTQVQSLDFYFEIEVTP